MMLRKIPKATTAVVSLLLATFTIALTLTTLTTVSAEETTTLAKVESTSTETAAAAASRARATTAHTEPTAAVISERSKVRNGGAKAIAVTTTTTTFLTLQPPSFDVAGRPSTEASHDDELVSRESEKNSINHEIGQAKSDKRHRDETKEKDGSAGGSEQAMTSSSPFLAVTGQGFRLPEKSREESKADYIEFEHRNSEELAKRRKQRKRTETVNEVLSNLFPNGFSDIFRFSYASEQQTSPSPGRTTTTVPPPKVSTTPTPTSNSTPSPATKTTTTTTTTEKILPKPSVTFTTSISKQYRRVVSPGHEEIVVEKLTSPPSSEEFRDGSNSISKSDLLRINRAAAEASVLPSLLLNPESVDRNATNTNSSNSTPNSAPIVILKEHSSEQDDTEDEVDDDNQIAESQDIVQHLVHRLPNTNVIPAVDQLPSSESAHESNEEIRNDQKGFKQTQKRAFGQRLFTSAADLRKEALLGGKNSDPSTPPIDPSYDQPISQQQDHYQQEAEKVFVQPSLTTEAPSRQFLKHFNPQLSGGTTGLVKKGNFHYEIQRQRSSAAPGDYESYYIQPAAQLEYQRERLKAPNHQPQSEIKAHSISSPPDISANSDYQGYDEQQEKPLDESSLSQNSVVFVTLNTPAPRLTPVVSTPATPFSPELPGKSPHEYVAEAVGAASQRVQQQLLENSEPKSKPGYTFVEIQKSVNIHNKLITEKDGRLVEQHETIYHQPQYAKNFVDIAVSSPPTAKDYVSLSDNPIRVQQIDSDGEEIHEEAASHHSHQTFYGAPPPPPQHEFQTVEKIVPQPYPVPVEKIVERPYPVTQVVEKQVPAPYPVKEIVEKIVDRPVPVEKIVERPINIPYPVHVDHYVDRPYPVHEYIETHVPVPYPEPVAVPVPVDHYIDRPYPVETVVEKRIPYPVEKVVEKVVEKHVPVEKIVEKVVDRPIAVPIHVPIAVPVHYPHSAMGYEHPNHPNALGWVQQEQMQAYKIPEKVLQNYYSRMIKKFLNSKLPNVENSPAPAPRAPHPPHHKKPTQPKTPIQFTKPPFKISDIRYDLKPPPAPLGPSWSKGARYMYKTLPKDLSSTATSKQKQKQEQYFALLTPDSLQAYDELSEWRVGHLLKRSPDFGRNLHIEYGFKPPLVPSVEIDDKGVPLSVSGGKGAE